MLGRKIIFFSFLLIGSTSFAQVFTEKSETLGVNHRFESRALMGGGCAFFDFDGDGDDDLYMTGGNKVDALYRNDSGTFTSVGTQAGFAITAQYYTTGVSVGDLDNDGHRDLLVTTWVNGEDVISRNLLFRNNGNGTFTEIGENAGFTETAFSIGANMFDYNRDGLLDIYVINHVNVPGFTYDENGTINGFAHECYPNHFYINNGNFTFTEEAGPLGVASSACTLASLPTDYNNDGNIDLFIANDFGPFIVPNELYENQYPNGFDLVDGAVEMNKAIYGMGIANGDFDNDLDLDYYVTNLGQNLLLENINGVFEDKTVEAGVKSEWANQNEYATGWGTAFLDVNNDSWLDLFVSNGRIPSLLTLPTAMMDPDKLFLNNGDGTFTDISEEAQVADVGYGRGMAYSDFDQDGDLDLCVMNLSEFNDFCKIYENPGNQNNYVQIKLQGTISNRDAIGSKIYLYTPSQTFLQETFGGGASHCSQHSATLHFGLGLEESIDSVKIIWPSGNVENFIGVEINQKSLLVEGSGSVPTIDFVDKVKNVKYFPNPFHSDLNIVLENEEVHGMATLIIRNILGGKCYQTSFSAKFSNQISIPENLEFGIYVIELKIGHIFFNRKILTKQ